MENLDTTKNIEEKVDDFILRTYKIWESGKIARIFPKTKEIIELNTYDEFKKLMLSALEYSISSILEKTSLHDNEFFISSGGNKNNTFILTDKRLFISAINDIRKEFDIISIRDIKTIKFKIGWSSTSGTITLNDGHVLNYSKLDCGVTEEIILKLQSLEASNFVVDQNDIENTAITETSNLKEESASTESEETSKSGRIPIIVIAIAAGIFFIYSNREKLVGNPSIFIYIIAAIFLAFQTSKTWR